LRTGDLGFIEDGELFIVGRIKDTIIVRGINYGPEDIESTVAASHPAFLNFTGAAFGLIVDGEEQVVVVQEVGREVDGSIDWDAAARDASNSVTREQGLRLHELVIVRQGTIPRTSSGKIRRGRCREMYQASLLDRLNLPAALKSLAINMTARSS